MVNLTLSRSDTLRENHNIPNDAPQVIELGPFEYVEITYDLLRIGPEGDFIGAWKDGAWWLDNDSHPFSDIAVTNESDR